MAVESSVVLDGDALQNTLRRQGENFFRHISEHCPHLFANIPVFITAAQVAQMRAVVQAVERVVVLPGWREELDTTVAEKYISSNPGIPAEAGIQSKNNVLVESLDSGLRRNDEDHETQHSAKGVFFGYDFHLNAAGAHLIEINTNAGGAFLNALLLDSQRAVALSGAAAAEENIQQTFLAMFRHEWQLARSDAPLSNIAIVDEQPETQYLYPEFLLAKTLFERGGIIAHITDPAELQSRNDGLYFGEQKIDLVYNRLTDFSLQRHPALLAAYQHNKVVLTPHPHAYTQYADKRNLARLTDAQGLRALGANETDIATLQAGVPQTVVVRPDMEATLWAERKQWFFKPVSGYGSKGAYRGANVTKRVFEGIMHGDYVAQRMAPPGECMVSGQDAKPVALKFDVRCYVYDGKVQLIAARLYQGQTTNFRTPGGGFALVRIVG